MLSFEDEVIAPAVRMQPIPSSVPPSTPRAPEYLPGIRMNIG